MSQNTDESNMTPNTESKEKETSGKETSEKETSEKESTKIPKPKEISSSTISELNSLIYFGSSEQSTDTTEEFQKLHIGAVINCQGEFKSPPNAMYDLFNFNFDDDEGSTLMENIDAVMIVVNDLLKKKKKIYVQCATGNSISPAILIYLLMVKKEMSYDRAYRNIRRIRSSVDINPYFQSELRTIDEWCNY